MEKRDQREMKEARIGNVEKRQTRDDQEKEVHACWRVRTCVAINQRKYVSAASHRERRWTRTTETAIKTLREMDNAGSPEKRRFKPLQVIRTLKILHVKFTWYVVCELYERFRRNCIFFRLKLFWKKNDLFQSTKCRFLLLSYDFRVIFGFLTRLEAVHFD